MIDMEKFSYSKSNKTLIANHVLGGHEAMLDVQHAGVKVGLTEWTRPVDDAALDASTLEPWSSLFKHPDKSLQSRACLSATGER